MGSVTELFDTTPSDTSTPSYIKQELQTNPQEGMMRIINDTNANKNAGIDLPDMAARTPASLSNDQRNQMLRLMAGQGANLSTPALRSPQPRPRSWPTKVALALGITAVGQRLTQADRLASCGVEVRRMQPFEEEDVPLFTVGQVAEMLSLKQAFLRRVDQLQVVSPQRSNGGQRRYTRIEIRIIQQVASMADEGMTMPAIRRIIELEQQLAEVARQRDELAARLSEASDERSRLAQQLKFLLTEAGRDRSDE